MAVNSFNAQNPPVTTKGDVFTFSTIPTRLGVGANDTVLTADSSTATGLKWAAPTSTADNFTLINAGGTALTGAATITVSGISGKNSVLVFIDNASSANASSNFGIRFNADTGANYNYTGLSKQNATMQEIRQLADTDIEWGTQGTSAANTVAGYIRIDGANAAGIKPFTTSSGANAGTPGNSNVLMGHYAGTSAITSVSIISSTGNFDGGTIYVYGA